MPVAQAVSVQRLAGHRLQQPDARGPGITRQLGEQRQAAAVGRAARVAGNRQARRRKAAELFEQLVARLAAVEDAGVAYRCWQGGWPWAFVVQFQADQQGAIAVFFADATDNLRQGIRRGIVDAQAFAAGHQGITQLTVAGQVEVQLQARPATAPAPQAQGGKQQARDDAIHQQYPEQPAGPGLAGQFQCRLSVAAGADHGHVRHTEAEQRRQGTQGLGQGHEGVGAKNGGFPDKAITPGRQ
ncbi:hypothetical protein D3C76_1064700 [compost metagenome]